jgi:hypothetical protein
VPTVNVRRQDIGHRILAIEKNIIRDYPKGFAGQAAVATIDKDHLPIDGQIIQIILIEHREHLGGRMQRARLIFPRRLKLGGVNHG